MTLNRHDAQELGARQAPRMAAMIAKLPPTARVIRTEPAAVRQVVVKSGCSYCGRNARFRRGTLRACGMCKPLLAADPAAEA